MRQPPHDSLNDHVLKRATGACRIAAPCGTLACTKSLESHLKGENASKSQAPRPPSPQDQILGNQPAKFGKSLWTLAIATLNGSNFGHPGWKGSHMRPKSRVDHEVQWLLLLLKQTIWVMSVLYSYIPFLDSPVQSHSSKRVKCWWFRRNRGWFLLGLYFPPYSGSSCRLSIYLAG